MITWIRFMDWIGSPNSLVANSMYDSLIFFTLLLGCNYCMVHMNSI